MEVTEVMEEALEVTEVDMEVTAAKEVTDGADKKPITKLKTDKEKLTELISHTFGERKMIFLNGERNKIL